MAEGAAASRRKKELLVSVLGSSPPTGEVRPQRIVMALI